MTNGTWCTRLVSTIGSSSGVLSYTLCVNLSLVSRLIGDKPGNEATSIIGDKPGNEATSIS